MSPPSIMEMTVSRTFLERECGRERFREENDSCADDTRVLTGN